MNTAVATDLAPQRPRYRRGLAEPQWHLLEPEWPGTRVLVRIGHQGPRFVGYAGPVEGPRELYDAIVAEARCDTAVIDGVLVHEWRDDPDLELDPEGNAYTRANSARAIFAAFDLLEVDGTSLVDLPLLERKRHLEGLLKQSRNVRLTAYVTRGLRMWRETFLSQGFKRVVLKSWNSTYSPGRVADDWVVVDKIDPPRV